MKIELKRNSKVSLIQQIHDQIADRIRSNILEEGSILPSIRELSKEACVSQVTVSKAYSLLEKNGLIQLIHGKGAFVTSNKNGYNYGINSESSDRTQYDWQLAIPDYVQRAQFMHYQRLSDKTQFASATISPGLLPTGYLSKEIEHILNKDSRVLAQYSSVQGDPELRQEIKNYLQTWCEMNPSTDSILITSGVQQGIDLIARTFIGSGDIVVTEAPTYTGAIDSFRNRGATILPVPVDEEGMRTDILDRLSHTKKPKVIYTNPSFQNPTGTVLSMQRRYELLKIAEDCGSIIIEDDSWNEMYFDDTPPPVAIKNLDRHGHVIYLKGFSKTLAPGCRIGAIVASGTIFKRLLAAKSSADLGSPLITQKAIIPFLRSKRMTEHVKKLRIALEVRRDKTLDINNE